MLPRETTYLNYMRDESSYFTNQIFKETRRMVMLDYAMAREHFVDMGEQMLRHIEQILKGWQEMLTYYSDLNNARKESDSQFVQK